MLVNTILILNIKIIREAGENVVRPMRLMNEKRQNIRKICMDDNSNDAGREVLARLDVHDALEEALANALSHANYYGRRGILVVKKGKELSISNPGTIRVTKEEFYAGGNSNPRNPNILKMFGFVNVGERAGSGVDKIMTAWAEQNWKKPEFDFSERNDRVTLTLEVGQVVYIPRAADIRKENINQSEETAVTKEEKILEYIRRNGSISSQEAADIGGYKSKTGARKLLDKMIAKDLIKKVGKGQATKYVIQ